MFLSNVFLFFYIGAVKSFHCTLAKTVSLEKRKLETLLKFLNVTYRDVSTKSRNAITFLQKLGNSRSVATHSADHQIDLEMSPAAAKIKIGIVGGTGFYNMPQLENKSVVENIRTEFGPPSSDIVTGTIDGVDCAVLAR